MNYKITTLAITFLLFSCVSFLEEQVKIIDPEIVPFYDTFILEGVNRGVNYSMSNVSIRFSENLKVKGTRYHRVFDDITDILINKQEWEKSSHNDREVLIMHELGHGFLNRDHKEDCYSVMISGARCKYINYQSNRDEMLDELFSTSY